MSLFADFPALTGSDTVGCHDLEWSPRPRAKKTKTSVLMRLYYPAAITGEEQQAQWLSHAAYGRALCNLAHLPSFLGNWLSGLAVRKQIQAYADARVCRSNQPFPVVIFSHGLGGSRHLYSSFCSDLASHGFVVAAIEHRDQSASLARDSRGQWLPYNDLPPEMWAYRHEQLQIRMDEVELCLQAIYLLSQGRIRRNAITRGFAGKLDLDSLVMAGHSFGGATTMLALAQKDTPFRCGLLLDPWAQPLMTMEVSMGRIQRPVIAVLSEQFSFWPDNFESVQELLHVSHEKHVCLSLIGTEHQHQSDVLLVLRYLSRFDFRSPFHIDPVRAMELNTAAAVAFIERSLKRRESDDAILDPARCPAHVVFH